MMGRKRDKSLWIHFIHVCQIAICIRDIKLRIIQSSFYQTMDSHYYKQNLLQNQKNKPQKTVSEACKPYYIQQACTADIGLGSERGYVNTPMSLQWFHSDEIIRPSEKDIMLTQSVSWINRQVAFLRHFNLAAQGYREQQSLLISFQPPLSNHFPWAPH